MKTRFTIYVDDILLAIAGDHRAVRWIHATVTEMMTMWITSGMRKNPAADKLVCIAGSRPLRSVFARRLHALGFKVTAEGELLGIDCAAGAPLRSRSVQRRRARKAARRITLVRRQQKLGGAARRVLRDGVAPEMTYGASVVGLPPKLLRARRRVQAAASRISTSASSLTAKLAIGGTDYDEADPLVCEAAPPFMTVLDIVWDDPRSLGDVADAWRQAHDSMMGCTSNQAWRATRGPVSSAMAHLKDLDIEWSAPFTVQLLGQAVSMVATPRGRSGPSSASTRGSTRTTTWSPALPRMLMQILTLLCSRMKTASTGASPGRCEGTSQALDHHWRFGLMRCW